MSQLSCVFEGRVLKEGLLTNCHSMLAIKFVSIGQESEINASLRNIILIVNYMYSIKTKHGKMISNNIVNAPIVSPVEKDCVYEVVGCGLSASHVFSMILIIEVRLGLGLPPMLA